MKELINNTWDLIELAVAHIKEEDENVIISQPAKDTYNNLFREKYNFIKNNFMKKSVKFLDRHKVASIIIASIIESDAIIYNGPIQDGYTFFGKYMIAVSVGLSYMQHSLNKLLEEKKQNIIESYIFPLAFSCNTKYFEIFTRNLYFTYEFTDWKLNLLDISENLFLIEYMTLEKNNININILRNSDLDNNI